jgi:uncharacterized protein
MTMMKHGSILRHVLLAAALFGSVFATFPAQSAPPTEAQVDRLMDTMDMRRTLDEMFVQMDAMGESMGMQMLGEDATPEQRASLKRITEQQQVAMRKAMSWDTMAPIYRRIYTRLFSAEEVEAMTMFYGSEHGRSIMRKMPQAMQLSMEEMQPMIQTMIADMQKNMEAELQNSGKSAQKDDAKH